MATLQIQALGRVRVSCGETPLHFPATKVCDLLVFLLLRAGETLRRDWIAERLWPMHPPGRARRSLSTALWRLRQVLAVGDAAGSPYIHADRERISLTLTASHTFDVALFEQQAAAGLEGPLPLDPPRLRALEEALVLYRGDFLESCYDDWCLVERERLQLLLLRLLKRLQRNARLCGAYDQAISYGQRLVGLDPLQEEVHRELMRCYAEAGQRSMALTQFQRCLETLRRELQVEPMPETWRLYRRIRGERPASEAAAGAGHSAIQSALGQFRRALDALESAWQSLQAVASEFVEPNDPAVIPE